MVASDCTVGHNSRLCSMSFLSSVVKGKRMSTAPRRGLNRREFVKQSALIAGATFAIGGTKSSGNILGANDTIRIACAGLNGRGASHVGAYSGMKGVEITYLVDPDSKT